MISSFVGVVLPLFIGVATLVAGTKVIEVVTGNDVSNFVTDVVPNLFNFVSSIGDMFRTFFELLPGGIRAIFVLFVSFMIPFLLYKFFKG